MSSSIVVIFIVGTLMLYAIISRICECIENITKDKRKEKLDE